MSIGKRITHIRGKESRKAFATRIGIVENTLRNYEMELSLPNSDVISKICRKLNISLEWLVFGTGSIYNDTQAPLMNEQAQPEPQSPAPEKSSNIWEVRYDKLEMKLEKVEAQRDELVLENRKLMQENSDLRAENATLHERQRKEDDPLVSFDKAPRSTSSEQAELRP